jgi:hypothetical protein
MPDSLGSSLTIAELGALFALPHTHSMDTSRLECLLPLWAQTGRPMEQVEASLWPIAAPSTQRREVYKVKSVLKQTTGP